MKKCTLPITSARPVDLVVTELAVIAFPDGHATLLETAPSAAVADVVKATEAELVVPDNVPEMTLEVSAKPLANNPRPGINLERKGPSDDPNIQSQAP
jgi:hypothetical protein